MLNPNPQVHATSSLGAEVVIWAGTHIREYASIGDRTSIGQYCYVGPGVRIGSNCKIQNQALIYEPAIIEDEVFIGPRVVITNDLNPRAVTSEGTPKSSKDWLALAAKIEHGASLGAGCICVGPVNVGKWAMVAAGAVVVKDIPPYALVAGVPAKQIGWVGRAGIKLAQQGENFVCPKTGQQYALAEDGTLHLR